MTVDVSIADKDALAPESAAGAISKLFFFWVVPFVRQAHKAVKEKRFDADLLPPIPLAEHPEHNIKVLKDLWDIEQHQRRAIGKKPRLWKAVLGMMSTTLCVCMLFMSIQALLTMSSAYMLSIVVSTMQGAYELWVGFLTCALIGLVTMAASVLQQYSWHMCSRNARQTWIALSGLIFEKPAKLSSGRRSDVTDGEIINMMSVDAQQVLNSMQFFAIFSSAPMYIIVPSVFIPMMIGWPFVIGFVIFILTSFVNDRIAKTVQTYMMQKMKAADARNTRLNESFQGIRTVKLNAWEDVVEQRVELEREKEIKMLKRYHFWQSLQQGLAFAMPTIATCATYMVYVQQGGALDPATIFMSLSLFEFLALGTNIVPHMMNMLRTMRLAFDRMEKLLVKEDDFGACQALDLAPGTVRCLDAEFRWQSASTSPGADAKPVEDASQIRGASMEADPGDMLAICGRVGSGKSTWAGGLLGFVSRQKGSVGVGGSVAYVPQVPQILNANFRENILFGSDMDEEWYDKVLQACALKEDLKQFEHGDRTEIGERGITISGGQKQRVAIARAAYSNADVMIFDDPLSAMDAHVGRQVFENCFKGLLGKKTRIFFTNQLQFCVDCNKVYMLENGQVAESGTYRELVARSPPGPFGVFLQSMVGDAAEQAEEGTGGKADDTSTDASKEPAGAASKAEEAEQKLPAAEAEKSEEKKAEEAKEPAKAPAEAADKDKASKGGKLMSKETKKNERIGIGDWMTIARASKATFLGVMVIVFTLVAPLFQYGTNFFLSLWTDRLLDESGSTTNKDPFEDMVPSILFMSSAVAFGLCLVVRGLFCLLYFLKSSRNLHRAMLAGTVRQTMTWFDTTPVGRILNRFGNDVNLMDSMLPMLFQMWSLLFGRVIVVVIVAGITAPPALLLSLGLLFGAKIVYGYYGALALDMQRVQMMALSPLLAAQSGFLGALDTIRCFDRVDVFVRRFFRQQYDFVKTFYWQFSLDRAMQAILTAFAVSIFFSGVAALLLTLAVYETPLSALVSPGNAGLVLAFCSMLAFQIPVTIFMTARVEAMMAGVQRVAEYRDLATEDSLQKQRDPVAPNWPSNSDLKLNDVQMRYSEDLPLVLKGVNFSVTRGERVAIVGRTGSGKSSILLSCFRMMEVTGGSIELDGVNIAKAPLARLRAGLGVIPQDSWLFSGTIRSNLDVYGKHSDEEIWTVLRHVHLEDQVKAFELGLDHEVREKGENLSVGTSQLLCLARVLLKRPMLLFMDEATASVDSESDGLVQETLRKPGVLPDGCSIVTIAHRLQTVIDYDKIVVLHHGEVVEIGRPIDLLDKEGGHFAKLVASTGESSAKELRRRGMLNASNGSQAALVKTADEPKATEAIEQESMKRAV